LKVPKIRHFDALLAFSSLENGAYYSQIGFIKYDFSMLFNRDKAHREKTKQQSIECTLHKKESFILLKRK
jgi:hypothetical protein